MGGVFAVLVRPDRAIADTDGDGAGNTRSNERNKKFLANLPDHLVRRNTTAARTSHKSGGTVPSTLDQAVDVLEKTGGAFVLHSLACQPSGGTLRRAVR